MTSVLVNGARTPMARLLGGLRDVPATRLGGVAIRGALERAGVAPELVQYVIMGQVLQAGSGQMPARQAAVAAGIPMTTPALNVNKVCLSGLDAIALADQLIRAGEFDLVVAGGMESMSNAPHLLLGQRLGYRYGDVTIKDHMALDGLTDAYDCCSMGESTDRHNAERQISREAQDAYGAQSHRRAALAQKNGVFAEEITPVEIPPRRGASPRAAAGAQGDPVLVTEDEGIRPETTVEILAKLRPAFSEHGTITAGTSSPITDGACAVVVASREKAEELGLDWIAEIGAHGNVAGPDNSLHSQPANAIRHALRRQGADLADLDVIEINEAFAAVAVESIRELGVDPETVNVNGGSIALGHPIGASGARLALTLALELKRRGGGLGAAALCGGGGQGDALLLRVPRR